MLMTEYETTVVVRPDVSGDQVETALDRVRDVIKKQGGKLVEIEHWGKKKLAYPMARHPRGIFVRTHFLAEGGLVSELERNLRLNENILRFMTIKVADRVEAESLQEKEYVAPSYDEAEELDDDFEASADHDDDSDRYRDDGGRRGERDRRDDDGPHGDDEASSEAKEE